MPNRGSKKDNRCDSAVMKAIARCGCTKHGTCANNKSRHKPSEMKGSRIKSIIATITVSTPGVDTVTILNERIEDNKEYVVCSSLAKLIKKEEKDLEKKKEEEERKRDGQQTHQPRRRAVLST